MRKRRVYLDACVFIAKFQPEKERPEIASGIEAVFSEIEKGNIFAVTSTIVFAELLDGSYEILMNRFDGVKGDIFDVERPIMKLARQIRSKLTRPKSTPTKAGKPLDLPDCVHLATAIHYGCDLFLTTDGYGNDRHSILNSADEILKEYKLKVVPPIDVVMQPAFEMIGSNLDPKA